MKCPKCATGKGREKDTRQITDILRRIRWECKACGHRWTTRRHITEKVENGKKHTITCDIEQ